MRGASTCAIAGMTLSTAKNGTRTDEVTSDRSAAAPTVIRDIPENKSFTCMKRCSKCRPQRACLPPLAGLRRTTGRCTIAGKAVAVSTIFMFCPGPRVGGNKLIGSLRTRRARRVGDSLGAPPACCFSLSTSILNSDATSGLSGQRNFSKCPQVLFVVTRWCRLP